MDKIISFLIDSLFIYTFPLVHIYHTWTGNCLLNIAVDPPRSKVEEVADQLLIPYHFLVAGKIATPTEGGGWKLAPRFTCDKLFWPKMAIYAPLAPWSMALGGLLKGVSYLAHGGCPQGAFPPSDYAGWGIEIDESPSFFEPLHYEKGADLNPTLKPLKECLSQIVLLLNEEKILWWLDCGSCLGAYRYGGTIPWDEDIDIGVLLFDFDRIFTTLSRLNPDQYLVQDWSGRDHPKSYIKVFCRKTLGCIDIYHFDVDREKKELNYILSLEENIFLPQSWKIREKRFKVKTPLSEVFPLQKVFFDAIQAYLPQNPSSYLTRRYGKNLAPAKVYNPLTGEYEKDPAHPYWQREFVH